MYNCIYHVYIMQVQLPQDYESPGIIENNHHVSLIFVNK